VDEVHASCKHIIRQYGDNFTETDVTEVAAIMQFLDKMQ
jgi:hypothetical protein